MTSASARGDSTINNIVVTLDRSAVDHPSSLVVIKIQCDIRQPATSAEILATLRTAVRRSARLSVEDSRRLTIDEGGIVWKGGWLSRVVFVLLEPAAAACSSGQHELSSSALKQHNGQFPSSSSARGVMQMDADHELASAETFAVPVVAAGKQQQQQVRETTTRDRAAFFADAEPQQRNNQQQQQQQQRNDDPREKRQRQLQQQQQLLLSVFSPGVDPASMPPSWGAAETKPFEKYDGVVFDSGTHQVVTLNSRGCRLLGALSQEPFDRFCASFTSLKTLDFRNHGLSGTLNLDCISSMRVLELLDLSRESTDGTRLVISGTSQLPPLLRHLDVSNNIISRCGGSATPAEVAALLGLNSLTRLVHLGITSCFDDASEGVPIALELFPRSLTSLMMGSNHFINREFDLVQLPPHLVTLAICGIRCGRIIGDPVTAPLGKIDAASEKRFKTLEIELVSTQGGAKKSVIRGDRFLSFVRRHAVSVVAAALLEKETVKQKPAATSSSTAAKGAAAPSAAASTSSVPKATSERLLSPPPTTSARKELHVDELHVKKQTKKDAVATEEAAAAPTVGPVTAALPPHVLDGFKRAAAREKQLLTEQCTLQRKLEARDGELLQQQLREKQLERELGAQREHILGMQRGIASKDQQHQVQLSLRDAEAARRDAQLRRMEQAHSARVQELAAANEQLSALRAELAGERAKRAEVQAELEGFEDDAARRELLLDNALSRASQQEKQISELTQMLKAAQGKT